MMMEAERCRNGHLRTRTNTYIVGPSPSTKGLTWRTCKTCQRNWINGNRKKKRSYVNRSAAKRKPEKNAYSKNYYRRHSVAIRARRTSYGRLPHIKRKVWEKTLMRVYGITPKTFRAILAMQGGACAICDVRLRKRRHMHVDHCHRTKGVRGILCQNCNRGLGMFKETVAFLEAAIGYLNRATITNIGSSGRWKNSQRKIA